MRIEKVKALRGVLRVSSDKSISHRAIILGSIAEGKTVVNDFLFSNDTLATIDCFRKLGVNIIEEKNKIILEGKGLYGLKKSEDPLYVGNSGTTIRIVSGLLAGQNFTTVLSGDSSIKKRPMDRIIKPLEMMGAKIYSNSGFAPLSIYGGGLKGIDYTLPMPSAQVKSAILMASLYADSKTIIREKISSRNHSELMLQDFGADIKVEEKKIISNGADKLIAREIFVPADISSAAFFILAASLIKGSDIILKDVLINETRIGFLKALKKMNAKIEVVNSRMLGSEKVVDLRVTYSELKAIKVDEKMIPSLVDEVPLLAVAGAFAEGETIISGAGELRFKESDRLSAMASELKKLGVNISELEDGLVIKGGNKLSSLVVNSHNDHRVAMALAVAGMASEGVELNGVECIGVSYPNFFSDLKKLISD